MAAASKKKKKQNPFLCVREPLLEEPSYLERSMFGCQASYLHGRLVLVLASGAEPWKGLLIPTDHRFHESLRKDFRSVKQHPVLKKWLYLPEASEDFEAAAHIVDAIKIGDERFGVEPSSKNRPKQKKRSW